MDYSIFYNIDIDDMIKYLETCGYEVITEDNDILRKIEGICKELKPHGFIDKEEAKKLICDYIDFWMNRSFK